MAQEVFIRCIIIEHHFDLNADKARNTFSISNEIIIKEKKNERERDREEKKK